MFGQKKKKRKKKVEQLCLKLTKPPCARAGMDWSEVLCVGATHMLSQSCTNSQIRTSNSRDFAGGGGVFWVIRRIWINSMCWQMEKEQMYTYETCRCNKCWHAETGGAKWMRSSHSRRLRNLTVVNADSGLTTQRTARDYDLLSGFSDSKTTKLRSSSVCLLVDGRNEGDWQNGCILKDST